MNCYILEIVLKCNDFGRFAFVWSSETSKVCCLKYACYRYLLVSPF